MKPQPFSIKYEKLRLKQASSALVPVHVCSLQKRVSDELLSRGGELFGGINVHALLGNLR
jgi:hypothetical protein